MSRPFKTKDADELVEWHQKTIRELSSIIKAVERNANDVRISADDLIANEAIESLEKIPISRLATGSDGVIRVGALKSRGIRTLADMVDFNPFSYGSRSTYGFYKAKQLADDIITRVREGTRVQLSVDDQNPESSRLVIAIEYYGRVKGLAIESKSLLEKYRKTINTDIDYLNDCSGFFPWYLSTKKHRKGSAEAYDRLLKLKTGDYGNRSNDVIKRFQECKLLNQVEAWSDFSRDPVRYIGILEEVAPEKLSGSTGDYGLPDVLAAAVNEEPLQLDGFKAALRRYQEWGARFALHQKRTLLGDDMGLGKTVEAIAVMVTLYNSGKRHFLVVCPLSVLENWCRELAKWWPSEKAYRIHGSKEAEEKLPLWIEKGGVAVTNYETLNRAQLLEGIAISLFVVDEAHYVKNPRALRTERVRQVGECSDLVLYMTGTALENRVDEMIELIRALNPEVAESVKGIEDLSESFDFKYSVAPVYMRRKREEVLQELPNCIDINDWLIMDKQERRCYEESLFTANHMSIRRLSWDMKDIEHSSKARRLKEIVDEAEAEGRKVIVYSFFLDTLDAAARILGDRAIGPLWGGTSQKGRQELIDYLGDAPAGTALLAQINVGGLGFNIQAASVVVICEPQLKPSTENQAIGRVHRMGQARNVVVHRLLCEKTVDEGMAEILQEKQEIFNAFADPSITAWEAGEIDTESMTEILEAERERVRREHEKSESKGKRYEEIAYEVTRKEDEEPKQGTLFSDDF